MLCKAALHRKGGTEEILSVPELVEIFLSVIQADVEIEEVGSCLCPGPTRVPRFAGQRRARRACAQTYFGALMI